MTPETPTPDDTTQQARPNPTSPPSLDDPLAAPPPEDPREGPSGQIEEEGQSYWSYVKRQYRKNTLARVALWFMVAMAAVAVFADFLANDKPIACSYKGTFYVPVLQEYLVSMGVSAWPQEIQEGLKSSQDEWRTLGYDWSVFPPVHYTAAESDSEGEGASSQPPFTGSGHALGTDQTSRDVLAGLIHGTRVSLTIGLVAMGIAAVIGILLGALAGYFGGWIDMTISRIIEVFLNFPTLFLVLAILAFYGRSLFLVMVVIGLTGWMGIARLIRGEVLRVRAMEYVSAARSLGFPSSRIIMRHVLPNSIGPVLVSIAFGIAGAILTESALGFLGFGVPATTVTWGTLLNQSYQDPLSWWLGVFPGLMIFLTVVGYNLIGDGLRDALDPRLRE